MIFKIIFIKNFKGHLGASPHLKGGHPLPKLKLHTPNTGMKKLLNLENIQEKVNKNSGANRDFAKNAEHALNKEKIIKIQYNFAAQIDPFVDPFLI